MIRTIITAVFLVFYFLLSLPLYGLIPLVGRVNAELADRMAQGSVKWALRRILHIAGVRLQIEGREHIPTDEAVLYIGNHQSYFDIVATYPNVVGNVGYVAKQEIDRIALLRYWMPLLHGLTFDREDPRSGMKMIIAAIDNVKAGYSMFIFPEGTRSKDGTLGEFKAGSFKISTRTNCPVIPVAITGTAEIFEKHIPFIRPADVVIRFGKPIRPDELDKEEKKHIARLVQGTIQEMLGSKLVV